MPLVRAQLACRPDHESSIIARTLIERQLTAVMILEHSQIDAVRYSNYLVIADDSARAHYVGDAARNTDNFARLAERHAMRRLERKKQMARNNESRSSRKTRG